MSISSGAELREGRLFRLSAHACWIAVVVGIGFFALHAGLGVGGHGADRFTATWVYGGLEALAIAAIVTRVIVVPTEPSAWAILAAGIAASAVGELVSGFDHRSPPVLSPADAFHLAFYPAASVALLLLVRSRVARFKRSVWLDGLSMALAVGAVGTAVLLEVRLGHVSDGMKLTVATDLLYPVLDAALLSFVFGVFWLVGRDAGLEWVVIGGAFLAATLGDASHLGVSAADSSAWGAVLAILWPLTTVMLAAAAWVPPGRGRRVVLEGRLLVASQVLCTLMALSVLLVDQAVHLNVLARALAAATILVVSIRTVATFRENAAAAAGAEVLSLTDPLTSLWNRRKLVADLEIIGSLGAAQQHVLVLYDLNGFKRFNDLFGHPAGDALLERLAFKLVGSVGSSGECYRLGGDEFCVLASMPDDELEAFLDATAVALSEVGEGFEVTTAFGCVFFPADTADPEAAMRIADSRLYARKHHSLLDRDQPHGVLLQALYEREPGVGHHLGRVAAVSVDIARRLNLDDAAMHEVELAAQLHDIGKLAIPDSILDKPGSLTPEERAFVRRHTIIGERILNAAPALSKIGVIVRATHEAFDGGGYPDGLAGARIPLAARIIAVADSYTAMTSVRPYRPPRSHDEALAELRAGAGSQFDPVLVDLFCASATPLAEGPAPLRGIRSTR